MTTVNLTPGNHTIEWSLEGYETIFATVDVSSTGIMNCINVTAGTCAELVSIVGNAVTGLLKQIAVTDPVCDWISGFGGWQALATFDIMALIEGYLGVTDLGFTVTSAHIMGAIAYYNNQLSSGNTLTGCDFT